MIIISFLLYTMKLKRRKRDWYMVLDWLGVHKKIAALIDIVFVPKYSTRIWLHPHVFSFWKEQRRKFWLGGTKGLLVQEEKSGPLSLKPCQNTLHCTERSNNWTMQFSKNLLRILLLFFDQFRLGRNTIFGIFTKMFSSVQKQLSVDAL